MDTARQPETLPSRGGSDGAGGELVIKGDLPVAMTRCATHVPPELYYITPVEILGKTQKQAPLFKGCPGPQMLPHSKGQLELLAYRPGAWCPHCAPLVTHRYPASHAHKPSAHGTNQHDV